MRDEAPWPPAAPPDRPETGLPERGRATGPDGAAARRRALVGRNRLVLLSLIALMVLFYGVTIVKMHPDVRSPPAGTTAVTPSAATNPADPGAALPADPTPSVASEAPAEGARDP